MKAWNGKFEKVYKEHYRTVFCYIKRMTGWEDREAELLAQQVFWAFWQEGGGREGPAEPAVLLGLAREMILQNVRRNDKIEPK